MGQLCTTASCGKKIVLQKQTLFLEKQKHLRYIFSWKDYFFFWETPPLFFQSAVHIPMLSAGILILSGG